MQKALSQESEGGAREDQELIQPSGRPSGGQNSRVTMDVAGRGGGKIRVLARMPSWLNDSDPSLNAHSMQHCE